MIDMSLLAVAIRCNASVIVTFEEKDFPAEVLSHYALETQHPDAFADNLFDLNQAARSPRRSGNVKSSNTLLSVWTTSWRRDSDKDSCRHRHLAPIIERYSDP